MNCQAAARRSTLNRRVDRAKGAVTPPPRRVRMLRTGSAPAGLRTISADVHIHAGAAGYDGRQSVAQQMRRGGS
jgi:hypothetical protein